MNELHLFKAICTCDAYKNNFHFPVINLSSMLSLVLGISTCILPELNLFQINTLTHNLKLVSMFVSKSVRMLCGVFSFFFIVRDHKHITCRSLENIIFHELLYLIQVQLSFCDIPNNLRSIVFFK